MLTHAVIQAINRMADPRAAPNRQAKAAVMMVCIILPPLHCYDSRRLIAVRQLGCDGRHIWGHSFVEMRIFVIDDEL